MNTDQSPWSVALRLLRADAPAKITGVPEAWPRLGVLLPHILSLVDHASPDIAAREEENASEMAWLLSKTAIYLRIHGRFTEARLLAENALAIDESIHGSDHPDVAVHLNILALILLDLGHPDEAKPLLERALTITETAYGPDHPIVGICRRNLALLVNEQSGGP